MGDRANVFVQTRQRPDGRWDGIGIYSHWDGQKLFDVATQAAKFAQCRKGDDAYFARIVVHRVLAQLADANAPGGHGLWVDGDEVPDDNQRRVLVINAESGRHWFANTDEGAFRASEPASGAA